MKTRIKEKFNLFITDSIYVNTFQFLTLNYRLYSANFWYNQCEKNLYFFDSLKINELFPKLINFNHLKNEVWNENYLFSLQHNKALVDTLYGNQNPVINIYDNKCNILQTTNFLDAIENNLLSSIDIKTLNQKNPYVLPIKENKKAHDLNVIQIDLDGSYLNLTNNQEELDEYINTLSNIQDKSIVIFNTQRVFFDTFDYMLYFLFKYQKGFYLLCDNGTSLYHFAFYKEHIVWTKIASHTRNKMFLRAVKNNNIFYNLIFDDEQYFNTHGIEDGKYQINDEWSISYYSNQVCNKTDLIQEFLDNNYPNRISNIINIDDLNNSSMFKIKLNKSNPKIFNYTVKKNDDVIENLIYIQNKNDWIKLIEYDI